MRRLFMITAMAALGVLAFSPQAQAAFGFELEDRFQNKER
jgi:hypothetical protein